MAKDSYICPNCGFVLPRKDSVISGWDCMHACCMHDCMHAISACATQRDPA